MEMVRLLCNLLEKWKAFHILEVSLLTALTNIASVENMSCQTLEYYHSCPLCVERATSGDLLAPTREDHD